MIYKLKNCRNGKEARYFTSVEIWEENEKLHFRFIADKCKFYCPYEEYNGIHARGDACEILIGADPQRKQYYEIEISANNQVMIALMEYKGVEEATQNPILKINFVEECFVESSVERLENGYVAHLCFPKEKILSGDGEIYFNAYRLETDGGEKEKHLMALNPTKRPKFHCPSSYVYLKDYV